MTRTNYLAGAAWLLSATAAMAQTTRPSEVPQVTITGATKLLIFDWQPVPGATYYQLYVNVDGHSGFSKTGPQIAAPGTRAGYSVSVHLQHWQDALYRLSACNSAGCRDSKSLFPRRHMLETIGYFKASNTDNSDWFGYETALSADGSTLAVVAPFEASNAKGVDGNQADNSLDMSGAVYVYRKVAGPWKQAAYLKAPDNVNLRGFGFASYPAHALGLSADGSTLVVGAPASLTGDVPGEVVIFSRASNGSWSVAGTLHATDPAGGDRYGLSVDLSTDGNTLKVVAWSPGRNTSGNLETRTYLYARDGAVWNLAQTITVSNESCESAHLSGDGSVLAQYCVPNHGHTHFQTYLRSGSSWNLANDFSGDQLNSQWYALSHDGKDLAMLTSGVQLYRWSGSGWSVGQLIHSPAADANGETNFGAALAFNQAANMLAIGDSEASPPAPAGISESIPSGTGTSEGSVYIYQLAPGTQSWTFRSLVKAPNPDADDAYGVSVALSATGNTLAVGAYQEASKARGINGAQTDDSLDDAGAVYLY